MFYIWYMRFIKYKILLIVIEYIFQTVIRTENIKKKIFAYLEK